MLTGGNTYLYTVDQLGSVSQLTSSDGTSVQWTYAYDPFGSTKTETKNNAQAPTNLMKFTGEYLDPTGLYYLRARQYDPGVGRFTIGDPIQRPAGSAGSPYAYVGDRPTALIDPSGTTMEPSNSGQIAALNANYRHRPGKHEPSVCGDSAAANPALAGTTRRPR